jgi:hypothetical protein
MGKMATNAESGFPEATIEPVIIIAAQFYQVAVEVLSFPKLMLCDP